MDISTFNTVLGASIALGAMILSTVLGAILSYVRNMNKTMKRIEEMTIRHDTKIEQLEKQIPDIYDKIYKLNHV